MPATLDEIAVIVDAMPEHLKLFIVLAAFVGLREGELLELRRSDIDGITGRIGVARKVDKEADRSIRGACAECGRPISSPKTRSGVRTVHVPPPFLPMLQQHLLEQRSPSPASTGRRLQSSRLAPATHRRPRWRSTNTPPSTGTKRSRRRSAQRMTHGTRTEDHDRFVGNLGSVNYS